MGSNNQQLMSFKETGDCQEETVMLLCATRGERAQGQRKEEGREFVVGSKFESLQGRCVAAKFEG